MNKRILGVVILVFTILSITLLIPVLPEPTPEPASEPEPTPEPFHYIVLKCEFHIHTTASDGDFSPSEVVQLYNDTGFDVIAITDHNTMDGVAEAKSYAESNNLNMIVIGGEELTYNFDAGHFKHVIGLFLDSEIPVNSKWENNAIVKAIFDEIHAQGGVAYVAHPVWLSNNLGGVSFEESDWYPLLGENYIDGWNGVGLSVEQRQLIYDYGGFVLYDHDYHRGEVREYCYNYLFCYNRTESGVKDALINSRFVSVHWYRGSIGTPEALALYEQYF